MINQESHRAVFSDGFNIGLVEEELTVKSVNRNVDFQ
jgi:hypothetical protein